MIFARTKTQLDQRARVGHLLALPSVVGLVAAHGVFAGLIPAAGGFSVQVMFADQGLLNGSGSFGIDFLLASRTTCFLAFRITF